jgi:DNA processing protein
MVGYPETVYWLTLINESGLKLNLLKSIIQRWCEIEKRSLADDEADRAATARDKLARQAKTLAQWQAQGLELLIRTDPRYPQRWVHTLPPARQPLLLWGQGDLNLLNEPTVTMLGSQPPDEATANFVDELMQVLVAEVIGLVSGYGRGLDRTTFEMMLATEGGHAVVILPLGLNAFAKTTSKLQDAVETGQIALVSPFAPNTPFEDKFAEARNLLIDHLALTLLVLETNEDAQTRASAALDRGLPVLVRPSDTAANRNLIDQGALLLTDTGEVVEMVQQAMIDDTLLEQAEDEPVPSASSASLATPAVSLDPDADYALHTEDLEPIDTEEALDILSMGGEVPEILRQRLQKSEDDE